MKTMASSESTNIFLDQFTIARMSGRFELEF